LRLLLDNNILIQILAPNSTGLTDPATKERLERLADRAAAFVADVESKGAVMIIPAPVLSEFLIGVEAEKFQEYLDIINGNACFEVADFDTAAAVECALLPSRRELAQISPEQSASKLKYDRQIVGIALAVMADEVWTHDESLRKIAESKGLIVKSFADIEPPPVQMNFPEDES
jgi:predicted nucleic acid-binding protein